MRDTALPYLSSISNRFFLSEATYSGSILPLWSQSPKVIVGCAGVTGNTALQAGGAGKFNSGMQGFEITGTADAIGNWFLLRNGAREVAEVVPNEGE
jgi:hypothetical protein